MIETHVAHPCVKGKARFEREGAQLRRDNTLANWSRRAHAIASDPTSSTVAGTADPPTMNRWVTTAQTIVGMSRRAD